MQPLPETVMLVDSILQDENIDTQFKGGFAVDDSLQVTQREGQSEG